VKRAQERAMAAGVADRVSFVEAVRSFTFGHSMVHLLSNTEPNITKALYGPA
jgi:hypothetical protein